jgi:CrcB protein
MNLFAIAVGGFSGTCLRYVLALLFGEGVAFAWGTFVANAFGCFLLGWFLTFIGANFPPRVRVGIAVGFLGSLTTFSTFSIEAVLLIDEGHAMTAMIYIASSLLSGLLLVALGIRSARLLSKTIKRKEKTENS